MKELRFQMYDNTIAQKILEKQDSRPVKDFKSIDPEVDIENLNLNWREKDLPQKLRTKHVHGMHPYMGKFIPQLVEIFLRKFEPDFVYDPFCGCGTTLVEANTLGIKSIGTDISIFNVLLSRAKTRKYDIPVLEKEAYDILNKVYNYRKNLLDDNEKKKYSTNNSYLNNWFAEQTIQELLCYREHISNYQYQTVLKVILSRSARSARLVPHYDLDFPDEPQKEPYYCYKHDRICTPVQEAFKFFKRYTKDTIRRIREFNCVRTSADVKVIHEDSRKVELPRDIDMIFTSPPYLGLIDYHEQHKYSYELLDLENNEDKEIGAAKKGKSNGAKEDYIKGINQVLRHSKKYMTDNALAVIVINDKYNLYDAAEVGFEDIGKVERHVNRRTGRRNSAFFESVLIWRKK